MKFSRGFSILILLFILPSLAFAVKCPIGIEEYQEEGKKHDFKFIGSKDCNACASFICVDGRECGGNPEVYGTEKLGFGCPEDFYEKCKKFPTDIDFIRKKSPNRMDYMYNYTTAEVARVVLYTSGCGGEKDGEKCLRDLITRDNKNIGAKEAEYSEGYIYWNDGKDSNFEKASDNGRCSNGVTQPPNDDSNNSIGQKGNSSGSNGQNKSNPPKGDGSTGSSNRNGAFKFIGIIAFGWILSAAAAWIY